MTNEELLQIIEQAARDKVTELDLSGEGLTTLPREIVQLTNLQSLDLSINRLSSLPPEIVQLTNL
ncbi:MAG: leucine-rich repeat domain-containing protein, partial [Nostoc sp.]